TSSIVPAPSNHAGGEDNQEQKICDFTRSASPRSYLGGVVERGHTLDFHEHEKAHTAKRFYDSENDRDPQLPRGNSHRYGHEMACEHTCDSGKTQDDLTANKELRGEGRKENATKEYGRNSR